MVELEEQSEALSRFLPSGLADVLRHRGTRIGKTQRLTVTVLMSDVRGYSGIAERTDLAVLAAQLSEHRAEMSRAVLEAGGTVMQFAGDAVLAVFGAPIAQERHADHALAAAVTRQARQTALNRRWEEAGREAFGIGMALSTGEVAAALLGGEERLEYSVVGDVVNLSQRLQQWARPGEVVLSEPTMAALSTHPAAELLEARPVKGRQKPVGGLPCSSSQVACRHTYRGSARCMRAALTRGRFGGGPRPVRTVVALTNPSNLDDLRRRAVIVLRCLQKTPALVKTFFQRVNGHFKVPTCGQVKVPTRRVLSPP